MAMRMRMALCRELATMPGGSGQGRDVVFAYHCPSLVNRKGDADLDRMNNQVFVMNALTIAARPYVLKPIGLPLLPLDDLAKVFSAVIGIVLSKLGF